MKILVVSELYPPHFIGGYELQCANQVDGLIQRGHEVYVLTSDYQANGRKVENNIYRCLKYCRMEKFRRQNLIDGNNGFFWKYQQGRWGIDNWKNANITRSILEEIHPDVVYIWRLEYVSISPMWIIHQSSIPYVLCIGDYWLIDLKQKIFNSKHPLKSIYRKTLQGIPITTQFIKPNYLIFGSQYLRKTYAVNSIESDQSIVIYLGIQNEWLCDCVLHKPFLSRKSPIRLCYVGRVVPEKGVETCIFVLSQLNQVSTDFELDIIGSGEQSYLNTLVNMADFLGIHDKVRFLGKLPYSEVLNRYKQYDILIFPSRWEEPFGMVMLEAMAQGVLVVGSRVGAVPEIITDSYNGILADANSPESFVEGILKLVNHPDWANELRVNALQKIRESFLYFRVVNEVESYLYHVIKCEKGDH